MSQRVILLIVILSFCILPAKAQLNLHEQADQYFINKDILEDLNANRTYLGKNVSYLNDSLSKSGKQIEDHENNIRLLRSDISTIEHHILENKERIYEIDRNIHRIGSVSDKVSIVLLGISAGMIAGLWITSSALVLLWRR